MITVHHTLLRWPDRARARCGELRRWRASGGVMEVETRMVARGGTLWLAEQRARAQQRRWRRTERVFGMPARSDERGHRVDRDIRPPTH